MFTTSASLCFCCVLPTGSGTVLLFQDTGILYSLDLTDHDHMCFLLGYFYFTKINQPAFFWDKEHRGCYLCFWQP